MRHIVKINAESIENLRMAQSLLDEIKVPEEFTDKSLSFLSFISDAQIALSNALELVTRTDQAADGSSGLEVSE